MDPRNLPLFRLQTFQFYLFPGEPKISALRFAAANKVVPPKLRSGISIRGQRETPTQKIYIERSSFHARILQGSILGVGWVDILPHPHTQNTWIFFLTPVTHAQLN